MADYTTHSSSGGMWLIFAGIVVAIVLLLVVFGSGGGGTGTEIGAPDVAPAAVEETAPTAPAVSE